MAVDRFHSIIIRMIDVSYSLILCCNSVTVTTYNVTLIMCNVYSLRVSYTNRPKSSKTLIIMLLQLWIHNTHIPTCTWTYIISNLLCCWPALDGSSLMIAVYDAQYVFILGEQRRSCLFHVYIIFRPCVICQSFKSWILTLFSFCGYVLIAQIVNVLTVC